MLTGAVTPLPTQMPRPEWKAVFGDAVQGRPAKDDGFEPEESDDAILQRGGKLTANKLGLLAQRRVVAGQDTEDKNHDGIKDKDEENDNAGFLSEIQTQKLFDGIYDGLIRPDNLSRNKQGYLTHEGTDLTFAHKQAIEDKHKVCLAGRTKDEIDPATGKAYVVDEKTGLTKITMDDINRLREGSTSLARDDSQKSRIANTFGHAHDYDGDTPLDNPAYRAPAPRPALSAAVPSPSIAPL